MLHEEGYYWERWLSPAYGSKRLKVIEHVTKIVCEESARISAEQAAQFLRHCKEVEDNLHRLLPFETHEQLNFQDKFCLLASAWLHDLGKLLVVKSKVHRGKNLSTAAYYKHHHRISEEYIYKFADDLGLSLDESGILGKMCFFHSRDAKMPVDLEGNRSPKFRLLVSYLRLADALHVDSGISRHEDYHLANSYIVAPEEKFYWIKSRLISSIGIDHLHHKVTVYFKQPRFLEQKDLVESIGKFQHAIINDLNDDVFSLQQPLIDFNITFYNKVDSKITTDYFTEKEIDELMHVTTKFYVSAHPSSTRIKLNLLSSLAFICGYQLTDRHQPVRLIEDDYDKSDLAKRINRFLTVVRDDVVSSRIGHFNAVNAIIKTYFIESPHKFDIDQYVGRLSVHHRVISSYSNKIRKNAASLFHDLNKSQALTSNISWVKLHEGSTSFTDTINIVLFGFSELVMKTLCGFRDAILTTKVLEPQKNDPDVMDAASDIFKIYVCESHSKTSCGRRDRLIYHDGYFYAHELIKEGFSNICLIPDIVVDTILTNNCIDFVIFGANCYDKEHFINSAGHHAIVKLARIKKGKSSQGRPIIVLSVTTDKYCDDIPLMPSSDKNVTIDSFTFWNAYGNHAVRHNIWVTRDAVIQTALNGQIQYYNPLLDFIPIGDIDYIINEEDKYHKISDSNKYVRDYATTAFVNGRKVPDTTFGDMDIIAEFQPGMTSGPCRIPASSPFEENFSGVHDVATSDTEKSRDDQDGPFDVF